MALREFRLPDDFDIMLDLLPRTFYYPENEEWSVQSDDIESMIDTFNGLRRMWWLARALMLIHPPLHDMMRGHIWEEDGQAVGLTNVMRRGSSDSWMIANVGVLPDYRRRGIARKLVEAAIDVPRERGGKTLFLDVVAGNIPAYTLYERLGFEHYTGGVEFDYTGDTLPPECPLPDGYTVRPLKLSDWQPRYELAQRTTPPNVQEYEPVDARRFKQPALVRMLVPVIMQAMGMRTNPLVVHDAGGKVVATAMYGVRTRKGGTNSMEISLDPDHAALASYLMRHLVRKIHALAPGRRTEYSAYQWQPALIHAAKNAGFVTRHESHRLGMLLN